MTYRLPLWGRIALTGFFVISIEVSAYQVAWYFSHGPAVSDLRIFITGVEMVRTGGGHELYHFEAQRSIQNRLYPEAKWAGLLPFNHLAYELLFYWPISHLPYQTALVVWALMNLGLVLVIARLLGPYTKALREATGVPLVLWLLAFYPVPYVLAEGQDSLIFLALAMLSLRCSDSGRSVLGGFALGLACFKFHLALLIAFFVFFLRWQWRALAGFVTASALVVGISRIMVGETFFADYLYMLRNQELVTPWGFVPRFMPNLRGLLQWSLASSLEIGFIPPIVVMVSAVLGMPASWIVIRSGNRRNESLCYAAAVLSAVLVSYHLHMQDLTIATLPMLVLLDSAVRGISRVWMPGLVIGVAGLYVFRVTSEFVPALLSHGCLLAAPLLLLWLVSLRALDRPAELS